MSFSLGDLLGRDFHFDLPAQIILHQPISFGAAEIKFFSPRKAITPSTNPVLEAKLVRIAADKIKRTDEYKLFLAGEEVELRRVRVSLRLPVQPLPEVATHPKQSYFLHARKPHRRAVHPNT